MMNMIVCHVCGATNDPGNRFCDQCGARLEQPLSQVTPPVLEAPPPQADPPTAVATLNCVVCGATVLPGMVFCDHCGADLRAHPPLSSGPGDTETTIDQEGDPTWLNSSLAPTIIPASADPDLPVVSPDDATVFAPSTQDDAWDQTDMADASTAPTMIDPDLTAEASPPLADPNVPTASPAELPAADVPVLPEESVPESDSIPPVSDDPPQMFAVPGTAPDLDMQGPGTAPDLDAPVPATAPDLDAPALSAEQQQLAEEIERHTSTIVNMEQMLTMYPAGAAPGYLVSALDDARQALADAEARQAARQQPVPDPAEVARLEADRTRHQATITQMEQILQMHPPDAAPAYLVSALEDARRARDATEQEMAALMGGSAGAATMPAAPPSVTPAPSDAAPVDVPASAAPIPAPPPVPVPPSPAHPRLMVVTNGQEITLPTDKEIIVVGREDPVSQIFPEVDLTPHGGETGGVSRQHAQINHQNDLWSITDLNSTNYTRVDGNRIQPNTPTAIHSGTRLQFGKVEVIFYT